MYALLCIIMYYYVLIIIMLCYVCYVRLHN